MTLNTKKITETELKQEISSLFYRENANKETVGIELETTPFKYVNNTNEIQSDFTTENQTGVIDILKKEFEDSSEIFYAPNNEGTPQFINANKGNITFEPGGQIEYSSSAQKDLKSAITETSRNVSAIIKALNNHNYATYFGAINPWHSVNDIDLKLKKSRYIFMDKFLKSVGSYGQQMMRLTSSIQVNLDLGEEAVMLERWKTANMLAPILTAIFSNSPFSNGQNASAKSFRSMIWQNMDRSRAGIIFDQKSSTPDHYLDYALNANVIMYPDQNGERGFWGKHISFNHWVLNGVNGFFPSLEDWKNHLTTLFPEVRPKGFFEFRCLDGQSRAWWSIPAIILSRIIYSDSARAQILNLLNSHNGNLADMLWKGSIMGVQAFHQLCDKVFKIALNSSEYYIEDSMIEYAERFYKEYTYQGHNPADKLLQINNGKVFTLSQFFDFENREVELAQLPDFAKIPAFRVNKQSKEPRTESMNAQCGCCSF